MATGLILAVGKTFHLLSKRCSDDVTDKAMRLGEAFFKLISVTKIK